MKNNARRPDTGVVFRFDVQYPAIEVRNYHFRNFVIKQKLSQV